MKRFMLILAAFAVMASIAAQSVSYGFKDPAFDTALTELGASAKVDLPGFQAEICLTWGVKDAEVKAAFSAGLQATEVYLAAGLASISKKPLAYVVDQYKKNRAKGWGALAQSLGIKPGSKEFKALKEKTLASAEKMKKKGKNK